MENLLLLNNGGSLLKGNGGNSLSGEVCDVLFANTSNGELSFFSRSNWPDSGWTPIGILIIPKEHGVIVDGAPGSEELHSGVISLVPMSYTNPQNGGTSESNSIYPGTNGLDVANKSDGLGRWDSITNGLMNYNLYPYVSSSNRTVVTGWNSGGYMSRQRRVGGPATWATSNDNIASPYAGTNGNTGGLNPAYVSNERQNNPFTDFKGIINTKILTDIHTKGQSGWKTASSITNNSGSNYAPAAACCARYKTIGTKAFSECTTEELRNGTGFWYYPAMGELAYIPSRIEDINDTIDGLIIKYNIGVKLDGYYNSSSETSSTLVENFDVNGYCYTGNTNKTNRYHVRAYMRI